MLQPGERKSSERTPGVRTTLLRNNGCPKEPTTCSRTCVSCLGVCFALDASARPLALAAAQRTRLPHPDDRVGHVWLGQVHARDRQRYHDHLRRKPREQADA